MTTYPNREHERADKAARRRALSALGDIQTEALTLISRINQGDRRVDADDTQTIAEKVRALTGFMAELGSLYDVREWHAADEEQAAGGTR